jgi:hypothetical protein
MRFLDYARNDRREGVEMTNGVMVEMTRRMGLSLKIL